MGAGNRRRANKPGNKAANRTSPKWCQHCKRKMSNTKANHARGCPATRDELAASA